jgi:hypothetical protein
VFVEDMSIPRGNDSGWAHEDRRNYRVAECFHFLWPVSFPSPILPAEMKTEASTFDCRAHRVIVLETVNVRNGFGRMSNLTTDYFFHQPALSEPGDIKPSGRVRCRTRNALCHMISNCAQSHRLTVFALEKKTAGLALLKCRKRDQRLVQFAV